MWFILVLILAPLLYYLATKNYNYWENQGVAGPKPSFFVGNIGKSLIGLKSITDIYVDIYKKFDGYPFVGIYRIGTPCLLIRDLDFVKAILVKDFKHFHDNDIEIDKEVDRIIGRNPFCPKRHRMETKKGPSNFLFYIRKDTIISRKISTETDNQTKKTIKGMFPILENISQKMVKFVEKSIENNNPCLESREVCLRYTLENVAACAFGLEGKSFDSGHTKFRELADKFLSPDTWNSFKILVIMLFPNLNKYLKIKFVSKEIEDKLIDMVSITLKQRRNSNVVRHDFLEYVSKLGKTSGLIKEDVDIAAQSAAFFTDGYETSSRVMSFVVFEISRHLDIQQKLRNEINRVCKKYNDQLTYEAIQEMTYLDACFNESMRFYPIAVQLSKLCTEEYTYTPTDPTYKKNSITVKPGTSIVVPLAAIQNDKKYIENPDEYIPERMLEKGTINKFVFMPFGEGPRACIGMRFAVTQIKLGLAQLVRNFELTMNKKTKLPLKFDPWFLMLAPKGGLWIDFKKIN